MGDQAAPETDPETNRLIDLQSAILLSVYRVMDLPSGCLVRAAVVDAAKRVLDDNLQYGVIEMAVADEDERASVYAKLQVRLRASNT